jgi:hypothetical protein
MKSLIGILLFMGIGLGAANEGGGAGSNRDHLQSDMAESRIDPGAFARRPLLPDFTAGPCAAVPRSLTQINGNLYRHTAGGGLAVHSGLVLITPEGALVIDPAMTCTAEWLRDEIEHRFNVKVRYVIYTHAHADHISGGQIFQRDGATVVANRPGPEDRARRRDGASAPGGAESLRQHDDDSLPRVSRAAMHGRVREQVDALQRFPGLLL